MRVIVMRGVPGSGKTTWRKQAHPDAVVCSADDYFTDRHGNYVFDGSALSKAHGACLRQYVNYLRTPGTPDTVIIVDNTNVTPVEMAPYIALADAYSVPYEIVRIQPLGLDAVALARRGLHSVPADVIGRMMHAMKNNELPRFWVRERIVE